MLIRFQDLLIFEMQDNIQWKRFYPPGSGDHTSGVSHPCAARVSARFTELSHQASRARSTGPFRLRRFDHLTLTQPVEK